MYVFASDVHLSNPHDKRYQEFVKWLIDIKTRPEIKKVFLMGDVFDLWLGDRGLFVERYKDVLDPLISLAQEKEVHLFEGNHDFQMGHFWKKNKITVHKSFFEFQDQYGKWLLTHGDLIDPEDTNYLWLRWFFRSLLCRIVIRWAPGWFLMWLGQSLSTTDQKLAKTADDELDFQKNWEKWTRALHQKSSFDFFVCGHYHYRTDLQSEKFRALNLGSWLRAPYKTLEFSKGDFSFCTLPEE